MIRSTFERCKAVYGYRQIQLFLLQDHGVGVNHKKVLRLMQEMGLRSYFLLRHAFKPSYSSFRSYM
ncbi:IS3 family transposase [Paenibacillus sp. MMS18-CY102]|nr:IS3 family transposase [Paenibacillus sp. MMS18-CY102]